MLNELGKALRKLRIDCGERILDMASKVKKSPAFISSIERNEREIPDKFDDTIIEAYNLTGKAAEDIRYAVVQSRQSFVIKPTSQLGKDTAYLLARRVNDLSKDQIKDILKILKGE